MAKKRFGVHKFETWAVFHVLSNGRMFIETADTLLNARAKAKDYKEKYHCNVMIDRVKITIPAWDGIVPNQD